MRTVCFLWCLLGVGLIYAADLPSKCCSQTSENISYTCENISTVDGFILSVPASVTTECLKECEHGWYSKNNTFLVDSNEISGNVSQSIVKVTRRNLFTHTCLDGAYWKMDCHCSGKLVVYYEAVSPKPVTKDEKAGLYNGNLLLHSLLWPLLCILLVFIAVLICCCRKNIKVQNYYSSVVNGVLSLR